MLDSKYDINLFVLTNNNKMSKFLFHIEAKN